MSQPPANTWTDPSEVWVVELKSFYAYHKTPYIASTSKIAWPYGYYPIDSDGGFSEYDSTHSPMAADGILFW